MSDNLNLNRAMPKRHDEFYVNRLRGCKNLSSIAI